jgi:hypothetical protein
LMQSLSLLFIRIFVAVTFLTKLTFFFSICTIQKIRIIN